MLKFPHLFLFFLFFFLVTGRGNSFLLDFITICINFYLFSYFIWWLNFCVIAWCISLASVAYIGHHMLFTINYQYSITPQGTDSGVDTYFGLCTYPARELRHRIDLKVACWFLYCTLNGVLYTWLTFYFYIFAIFSSTNDSLQVLIITSRIA